MPTHRLYVIKDTAEDKIIYCGKTSQSIRERWLFHKSCARTGYAWALSEKLREDLDRFQIQEVESYHVDEQTPEELDRWAKKEQHLIAIHQTHVSLGLGGCNMTLGGDGYSSKDALAREASMTQEEKHQRAIRREEKKKTDFIKKYGFERVSKYDSNGVRTKCYEKYQSLKAQAGKLCDVCPEWLEIGGAGYSRLYYVCLQYAPDWPKWHVRPKDWSRPLSKDNYTFVPSDGKEKEERAKKVFFEKHGFEKIPSKDENGRAYQEHYLHKTIKTYQNPCEEWLEKGGVGYSRFYHECAKHMPIEDKYWIRPIDKSKPLSKDNYQFVKFGDSDMAMYRIKKRGQRERTSPMYRSK